jgi:hypothetical protein
MFLKFWILFAGIAFVQIYAPPWANKELPLHARGKQLQLQLSVFLMHGNAMQELEKLNVGLKPDTLKEVEKIITERSNTHRSNHAVLRAISANEKGMQEEVKEKLFREYLEAEVLAEEKLAESLRSELDPMELDILLAPIAARAPFLSHPLAKHRLGFSDSQAKRMKSMVLSRAAISAKVIEGIDLSKGLPKQIDFGLNYATEKAKILSVLSEDQLAEYLQLVGAFEKGSTAREYILKLDYGAYVLEPIEKMVDSIDKKR